MMQHGFVIQIGPSTNPNYFTGSGYSPSVNEAKVFRTSRGGMTASGRWQTEDYGRPIPAAWFIARKPVAVSLVLSQERLL